MSERPTSDVPANSTLADDLVLVGQRDLTALKRVYDATSGQLLALCSGIAGSREAGEDVLQEVYIKVWNRAAGYDPERAGPMAWLATIARNSAIDAYRARTRRTNGQLSEAGDVPDGAKQIDQELIEHEDAIQALSLIDSLGEEQRNHIRAVFFEGRTYAELSDLHGVPLNTIKSRIHRALNLLNQRWKS